MVRAAVFQCTPDSWKWPTRLPRDAGMALVQPITSMTHSNVPEDCEFSRQRQDYRQFGSPSPTERAGPALTIHQHIR